MKKVTQEQIDEIKKLNKTLNLREQAIPTSFEQADRIIKEIKANWGE